MSLLKCIPVFSALAVFLNCTPYATRQTASTQYTTKIAYCEQHFNGASLSGQTLLVFPVLTRNGHDTASYFSPRQQIKILQKVRNDLHFSTIGRF